LAAAATWWAIAQAGAAPLPSSFVSIEVETVTDDTGLAESRRYREEILVFQRPSFLITNRMSLPPRTALPAACQRP
jgi:hypothetical protein